MALIAEDIPSHTCGGKADRDRTDHVCQVKLFCLFLKGGNLKTRCLTGCRGIKLVSTVACLTTGKTAK